MPKFGVDYDAINRKIEIYKDDIKYQVDGFYFILFKIESFMYTLMGCIFWWWW
jgi:hypothetical protein